MRIGGKIFENYTYIMGIINLTPDSFFAPSRKSEYNILKTAEKMIEDGASVLDIGAQSTRPNYAEVAADEEIRRFEKPLKMIKSRFDIPVSVDTYFSESAEAALSSGADMINDVWGLTRGEGMAEIIARYNASVCIMHNAKQKLTGDIFPQIIKFLSDSVEIALKSGIGRDRICLDGGIGFAKDRDQNFELLYNYSKLNASGYPLLIGTSRKSMFGGAVEDRLKPTLESTAKAVEQGVLFVRVHDVKENAEVIERLYGRN